MRPFEVGDRVRVNASGRVGAIVEYSTVTDRFFVVYDIGGCDWFRPSELTLTSEPLTPAPAAKPPKRPLWEVKTAYEHELDESLADGWEPFAATFVEQTDGRYSTWKNHCYHLRRRVEVPDVT